MSTSFQLTYSGDPEIVSHLALFYGDDISDVTVVEDGVYAVTTTSDLTLNDVRSLMPSGVWSVV